MELPITAAQTKLEV